MFKIVDGYLYKGGTVVLNKEDIKDAEEKDFTEVAIMLKDDFIRDSYDELELLEDEEYD